MKSKNKFHINIALVEVAYWYILKKRIEPTTGNLFGVMAQILKQINYINQNTKEKRMKYKDFTWEFIEK